MPLRKLATQIVEKDLVNRSPENEFSMLGAYIKGRKFNAALVVIPGCWGLCAETGKGWTRKIKIPLMSPKYECGIRQIC
jgi:hypothetical protein